MSALPPALASWAEVLGGLEVDVAAALGPMLLRLDELVGRQGGVHGPDGDPDGYDGLGLRGTPERLLVSEWLLAEDFPEEFVRRAVHGELLYLAPGRRQDPPHGRIRVLVDTGPDQAGAGRLVQLAALVVLARRGARVGADLRVGVLGEEPGAWLEGDLPRLLRAWLLGRRRVAPGWADVAAWLDLEPGSDDQAWLFCSPAMLAERPEPGAVPASHMLTGTEGEWTADGAATVEVRLGGERVTLPLPPAAPAIKALRGEGVRRMTAVRPQTGTATRIRQPAFPGADPVLVGRGADPDEIAWARFGAEPARTRVRSQRLTGTVFAAGAVGGRIVALHAHDGIVAVRVIGKKLAGFDGLVFPLRKLGLDGTEDCFDPERPLAPLLFDSGRLLVRPVEVWFRVAHDAEVWPDRDLAEAVATPVPDQPMIVRAAPAGGSRWQVRLNDRYLEELPVEPDVRAGHGWVAWSKDGQHWEVTGRTSERRAVSVRSGAQVLGVARVGSSPALVTRSQAGFVLRLEFRTTTRTLTAWSGEQSQRPVVHPTRPLIAISRPDGSIEVGDLETGETVARVDG